MLNSVQEPMEESEEGTTKTTAFIVEDDEANCYACRLNITSATSENSSMRLLSVHSLHHETFEIGFIDHVCPYCG